MNFILKIFSDSWCMSTHKFFEMTIRGHENSFIGFYAEDPSCPENPSKSFPTFVQCGGPGAIIPRDGASCQCMEGSSWNELTKECQCDQGKNYTVSFFFLIR